jgi:DNA-directed RNA polymerase subunit RPC12/RpoP
VDLACPACGSDRVIPLTFPAVLAADVVADLPDRPLGKCVECGHRVTAAELGAEEDD